MRIVLLGPYAPYRGGIAHFAASVRHKLADRGHEVRPITFSRQYPRILFPGRSELEAAGPSDDEPAERLVDSLNPVSWVRTARRIRRTKADAVIYSFWHPFFAPAYATIRRVSGDSVRHVALVHNALPHEPRPGDRSLARLFLKGCSGILTMSDSVQADVRRLVPSADVRRVAHPTYDMFGDAPSKQEARNLLGLKANAPVGLFFGFVRAYKGLDVLLEALPAVVRKVPDFRLIVAGEFYEPADRYLRLLERSGVRDHVLLFDEYVPSERVGRYFAAADVAIQPYRSATQSGVAQIAWHYDCPLIVTDVGGLAEVVPHEQAGLVVPAGDPQALAEAIVRFFREGLHDRLRTGARRQKEKYGWAPLVDGLESLLAEDS